MDEYDFMFEDEAGQCYEDGSSLVIEDFTEVGDEIKRPVIAHVGGRGGIHKTHTGVINAVHRAVGNVHSHTKVGRDVRKTGSAAYRPEGSE